MKNVHKLARNTWEAVAGRSNSMSNGAPTGTTKRSSMIRQTECVCVEVGSGVAGGGGTV